MRAALLLSLLTACGPAYDLSGDWTGDLTCGEGSPSLVMNYTLEPTDQDLQWTGDTRIQLTTSDNEEVDITFTLEFTLVDPDGGAETLEPEVDVLDCAEASFGEMNCWSAEATWDVTDDEINGSLSGFIINDGNCDFTQER